MVTPKKHRTYCKTCQDFTIHSWQSNEDLNCIECGTKETGYNLRDIDPELIEKQRARYKEMQKREFHSIVAIYSNPLQSIFSNDRSIGYNVVECDAGQKQIDEAKKQQRKELEQKAQEILDDYNDNYKKLNRNDKCSCGSGKKFKQCHLIEFRNLGINI
jgi:uncharacterized protein YchJ